MIQDSSFSKSFLLCVRMCVLFPICVEIQLLSSRYKNKWSILSKIQCAIFLFIFFSFPSIYFVSSFSLDEHTPAKRFLNAKISFLIEKFFSFSFCNQTRKTNLHFHVCMALRNQKINQLKACKSAKIATFLNYKRNPLRQLMNIIG